MKKLLILLFPILFCGCGLFGVTREQKQEILDSLRPQIQTQLDRAMSRVFEQVEEKVVAATADLDISDEAKAELTNLVVTKTKEAAEGVSAKVTDKVIEELDDRIPEEKEESKFGGLLASLLSGLGPMLLGAVRKG